MVLEALAAVSLASAVFQFVEFAAKLISKGNHYYRDSDGLLEENTELEATSKSFGLLNRNLIDCMNEPDPPKCVWSPSRKVYGGSSKLSNEEEALCEVARRCQKKAREFDLLLNKLRSHGPRSRWKSFRQAAKEYWSKDDILQMRKSLGVIREDLIIHLLVVMNRGRLHDAKILLDSNRETEKKISETISNFHLSIKQEMDSLSATLHNAKSQERLVLLDTWKVEHKCQLRGLSNNLSTIVREEKEKRFAEILLHSLEFPQLQERRAKVAKSHSETFHWILVDAQSNAPLTHASFTDWLKAKNGFSGIYWITGKAGSGKSTLMRYLLEDERTKRYLREWSEAQPLLLASCFFWNAGTPMQKSLNGLLQSLLYEMLSQDSKLALAVSPKGWQRYDLGLHHTYLWTDAELLQALQNVVKASECRTNFCFFVDGLD